MLKTVVYISVIVNSSYSYDELKSTERQMMQNHIEKQLLGMNCKKKLGVPVNSVAFKIGISHMIKSLQQPQ